MNKNTNTNNEKTTKAIPDMNSLSKLLGQVDRSNEKQVESLLECLEDLRLMKQLMKVRKDKERELDEPLLNPSNAQLTMLPIEHQDIWDAYEDQLGNMWTAEEINFKDDKAHFKTLNKNEQHFLKMVLAFFAASDGIVNMNLGERFLLEVQFNEAKVAYSYQMMMENIHSLVYSRMLENIIENDEEREKLFNAVKTIPAVKDMADWAFKWIESSERFAFRVVAFAIVEGVFFSGAFGAIWWFKKYKGKGKAFMPGLVASNDFIARDEGQHCSFACLLYNNYVKKKLSQVEMKAIMEDGVKIAKVFIIDSLPCKLIGMNAEKMCQYIEYTADQLLSNLNHSMIYKVDNPYPFMKLIGGTTKTNFFEDRENAYRDAYVGNEDTSLAYDEDF
jgi:ribonucleotide reductase beta subunit family protein with ferritin-like domain